MALRVGDIITISYVERCEGTVISTNIEQVARDNDIYDENEDNCPIPICIGRDRFVDGFHDELIGKEVGAKGIVLVPVEKAYGKRSNENVRSIDKKEFEEDIKVGDYVYHLEYENGFVVDKVGKKFVVDFNDPLAGRDITYEYEIHELITDPAEQFSRMVTHLLSDEINTSFEDGNGIIYVDISNPNMASWHHMKKRFMLEIFIKIVALKSIEIREKYKEPLQAFDKDERD